MVSIEGPAMVEKPSFRIKQVLDMQKKLSLRLLVESTFKFLALD